MRMFMFLTSGRVQLLLAVNGDGLKLGNAISAVDMHLLLIELNGAHGS